MDISNNIQENVEDSVFQYYTIVNNPNTFFPINQEDTDENGVLLLTLGQEDDPDGVKQEEEEQENVQEDTEETSGSSFLSNLKLITLEDGRMFVTASDLNEPADLSSIQELLVKKEETSGDPDPDQELSNTENEYQEVELEDGTRAIIDSNLWNNFLTNVSSEPSTSKKDGKRFPCLYSSCDKVYSAAHHLTVHMRIHTGCRPYQCTVEGCDKAFSTGYSLKAHTRTHTGEKPYACNACNKRFKTSGDLQKHIRTHTGEKPFKCPVEGCGRSFTTSNIRKVHIRSHTGERPYICKYANCGKAFSSATNHKNHMRIHSGERPYVCTVFGCGKRFTEYSSLYKHNAVHKPYKPHRCNICGIKCKQESTLRTHKRAIHNMIITDDGTEYTVTQLDKSTTTDDIVYLTHSTALCSDEEEVDNEELVTGC